MCTECAKVKAIDTPELQRLHQQVAEQQGFMPARYRLTATAPGRQPATQEVEVEGAAIYRVALSLAPAAK